MPGIVVKFVDDLPYGPGQSDYEYDVRRQELLDNSDFDAVTATQRDRLAEETPATDWK